MQQSAGAKDEQLTRLDGNFASSSLLQAPALTHTHTPLDSMNAHAVNGTASLTV